MILCGLCLKRRLYRDMYYGIICIDAGPLCGVLVGWLVLSFCPIIVGSSRVLVGVEKIYYML